MQLIKFFYFYFNRNIDSTKYLIQINIPIIKEKVILLKNKNY